MNHTSFFNSLKANEIRNVYLFHGEEEYIKEKALEEIRSLLIPDFIDLNYSVFDNVPVTDIMMSCDVAPFMVDRRITVCRFLPKEKDAKKLIEYMQKMPAESVLIFIVRGNADTKSSLYKKIKADGGDVLFEFLPEDELARWVVKTALASGCTINKADAAYMIQLVGNDLLSIKNELSKLCDYVGEGGVITRKIIPEIVIQNIEYQIYNTYSYFTRGKIQDGFRSLQNITNGKDKDQESFGIAMYFIRCLKAALVAHDLLAKKAKTAELEKVTGKRGYALQDLCAIAKKYTRKQLLDAIAAFANVGYAKIVLGTSSYNALCDAIIRTFAI